MQKKVTDYLEKAPVILNESYQDKEAVIADVNKILVAADWVTPDFAEKVLAREKDFPTGIDQGNFGIAIPHTDAECVTKEFIALVIPKAPVLFQQMDDNRKTVAADFVFVLGLNQPHEQLTMLQSLMKLIQNTELLKELAEQRDKANIMELLKKHDF